MEIERLITIWALYKKLRNLGRPLVSGARRDTLSKRDVEYLPLDKGFSTSHAFQPMVRHQTIDFCFHRSESELIIRLSVALHG